MASVHPSEPASAQRQGAVPNQRPDVEAAALLDQLPTIHGWRQVAAYQMLRSGIGLPEQAVVHGHYRQGEHVVVLTIADAGAGSTAFLLHFDATPPPMTDDAGTTTTFHRAGEWWLTEQTYREPFPEKVVPYFSYKMVMANEAYPRTPGLATRFSILLPNGIMVSAGGPTGTDPALVRQVFDAVDRRKLLLLAALPPAQP